MESGRISLAAPEAHNSPEALTFASWKPAGPGSPEALKAFGGSYRIVFLISNLDSNPKQPKATRKSRERPQVGIVGATSIP